jgi:carbon monoxide dehydrogenase subunit G
MQLENKFTIAAPIDKAWEALNTPQTIAPCFPGATLDTYEGDTFTGRVKVKLGPISLTYKGKGTYVSRDDAAHKVVIEANGRDSRGNGTASATVTGTMEADGPDKTSVTMVTDMTITGRPAQFGRGVISDVADKIIGQFAGCVADKLAPQAAAPASGDATAETAAAGTAGAGGSNGAAAASSPSSSSSTTTGTALGGAGAATTQAATGATQAAAQTTGPMRSEIDAIDLLDTAGAPVLKRLAPIAGGVLLLVLFIVLRRRKS